MRMEFFELIKIYIYICMIMSVYIWRGNDDKQPLISFQVGSSNCRQELINKLVTVTESL